MGRLRPRTKLVKRRKLVRCAMCGALVRRRTRCKRCGRLLPPV